MRAQGRRRLLALALPLTAALVAASAACSTSGDAAPGPTASTRGASPAPASSARPQVTLEEAGRALKEILAVDEVLGSADPQVLADRNHLLKQARDGHLALVQAAYDSAEAEGAELPRHTWGEPRLLVPRVQRGALWFAALVDRTDSSGQARPVVLTVVRQGAGDWQVSSLSLLDDPLPEVALDDEGYATALAEDDTTVQISPRLMAPLHATTAEEGTAGFAAGLIAEGPHTTAHAAEIAAARTAEKRDDCLGYDSIFAAAGYPVHALRTADGGALVMYSLIRTTTRTVKVDPCAPYIEIPRQARGLTSEPYAREELRTVETQQYVSVVPAKNSGGLARVIGYRGGITKVNVS
ncbi:lipoprotein [Planomonospora alba]|uniref:Lipoprotein n=1 Tax=Planomonospora alba TaxID=161354 RepID=A0ABP6MKK6_9ACTN